MSWPMNDYIEANLMRDDPAGALAAFCIGHDSEPAAVHESGRLLEEFQAQLTRRGVRLEWPNTLPV